MLASGAPTLIALDLETTGLHPQLSEIVEIGAIVFDPHTGEIRTRYETLVNPGVPIPLNVQAIHGISDEMVAGAPFILPAFASLEAFLAPHTIVVGHNISFDLGFLMHRAHQLGRALPFQRCIDTVHVARWAFPGLKSYKLVELRRSVLGMEEDREHRALNDAVACAMLFHRGFQQLQQVGHTPEAIWQRLLKPLPDPRPIPAPLTEDLRTLYMHCERGTRLLIQYRNAQAERSYRVVDPQGMQQQHSGHTLVGFCHLRQAVRHFRCDRIQRWEEAADRALEDLMLLQWVTTDKDEIQADPVIEIF